MAAPAASCLTLESLREMSLAGPIEMLALLKKVAADVMACEKGVDAKKKAEAVCQKILDMLDDVEKAGKVCLEGSIEKEKTTAVLAVVSQLKELVKQLQQYLKQASFLLQWNLWNAIQLIGL